MNNVVNRVYIRRMLHVYALCLMLCLLDALHCLNVILNCVEIVLNCSYFISCIDGLCIMLIAPFEIMLGCDLKKEWELCLVAVMVGITCFLLHADIFHIFFLVGEQEFILSLSD